MIDPAFWSDPDIEGAKSGVKLAALWLITNPQTSILGLCNASPLRFTFETGLPATALESALEALPRAFKRFGSVVFVRNYVRHQFGNGDKLIRNNFFVALKSKFEAVREEELRNAILSDYPEFDKPSISPPEGLTKPKEREGKVSTGEGGVQRGQFVPPDLEETKAYALEIQMPVADAESWYDHFLSNGWRVSGKTPMKDWKASLRNSKRNPIHHANDPQRPAESTRNLGTRNQGIAGEYANAPGIIRPGSKAGVPDVQRPDTRANGTAD